jgi:EAL domain-containing protein (putative c-di-GMP-specific phosphodiesterase class I)
MQEQIDQLERPVKNGDQASPRSMGMPRESKPRQGLRRTPSPQLWQAAPASLRNQILEKDLPRCIALGQLKIHYQPIVQIATCKLRSVEALARWAHPLYGAIPPSDFIPVAEETGAIVEIGEYMFRMACRQAAIWDQAGLATPIAVNLSSAHIHRDARVWDRIRQFMRRAGAKPELIALEITESALLNNPDQHMEELQQLRRAGVRIKIDDFGTGYCNFNYLKRLPADTLKLDRSFIAQIDTSSTDQGIVRAIVTMADNLGMHVIAEGVETRSQLEMLNQLGCRFAQGYWFSPAIDATECTKLLRRVGGNPVLAGTTRLQRNSARPALPPEATQAQTRSSPRH